MKKLEIGTQVEHKRIKVHGKVIPYIGNGRYYRIRWETGGESLEVLSAIRVLPLDKESLLTLERRKLQLMDTIIADVRTTKRQSMYRQALYEELDALDGVVGKLALVIRKDSYAGLFAQKVLIVAVEPQHIEVCGIHNTLINHRTSNLPFKDKEGKLILMYFYHDEPGYPYIVEACKALNHGAREIHRDWVFAMHEASEAATAKYRKDTPEPKGPNFADLVAEIQAMQKSSEQNRT